MKKRIVILGIFILLMLPTNIDALVKKSSSKYVTDEANVLNKESEDYIVKYSDFINKQKKIDIYVVTVKTTDTMSMEEYTQEVYNSFKIRDKGLLILLSKEDRKLRVQAGEDLSDSISSDLIDEYIDTYFIPYLEREKWNEGIINGYNAFYKYLCEEYGIDASEMEVVEKLDFITKYKTPIIFGIVWLSIMIGNGIAKYFKDSKKKKEMNPMETVKIMFMVTINIFLLSFAFIMEPIYLLFVLGFEGVSVYSSSTSANKIILPEETQEKKVSKNKKPVRDAREPRPKKQPIQKKRKRTTTENREYQRIRRKKKH